MHDFAKRSGISVLPVSSNRVHDTVSDTHMHIWVASLSLNGRSNGMCEGQSGVFYPLPVLPAYILSQMEMGMSMAWIVIQVFLNIHSLVLILFHTTAEIPSQSFMIEKYQPSSENC